MRITRDLNITTLGDGVVTEKLNFELQKVVENINDINMDPNRMREITLKLKFRPESQNEAKIEVHTESKLAPTRPPKPITVYIEKDEDENVLGQEVTLKQEEMFDEDGKITSIKDRGRVANA